ncbi:MAG TPA: HepT-like ribonuclease domain-containing protein [Ilumatobacteraceae bacterium]|nr:HepT-like ribonuclease domain-containing protein [Ilumatobacteraceae bacterium]
MRSADQRLADILAATTDAARIVQVGHRTFVDDPLLIRAAKNIISEIGEAAKALDDAFLTSIPGVPWKSVKGMRDKVAHHYPEVDIDLLWDTLVHGLPILHRAITQYMESTA